jgi:hypothetical protein
MGLDKELTKEEKKWLDDLWSLDEAPESIRFNKNFMLHVVKEDGDCVEYTSDELKNDKEIALLAVQNGRSALEHISINLKNDKEVVLVALQNGNSLEFASDDLRNSKEVVLVAHKNSSSNLRYLSDELKGDTSLAISLIKSANEKNKIDIFRHGLDNGCIEHFDASVFGSEELVNELVSVTLIPFLNILSNNFGMDNNVYNTIKIHKEKLEVAIKKDFEVRLEKAKEIVNNDNDFDSKISMCFSHIFSYYSTNAVACFNIDYNLVENSGNQDWSGLLSQKLFGIVTKELIEKLENQVSCFDDINSFIGYLSIENHLRIFSDHHYDIPRTGGKAAELFNKLPNYASEEDVSTIIYCIRSSSDWDVTEDCTYAFESIMAIIEEKISDKSIIDKLEVFVDIGQNFHNHFSNDFKSAMLESINEMDEAEKEDIYDLDEIVEYLKE